MTALDDQPPPIIAIGPANQTLPVNTIAVLPCAASGSPKPKVVSCLFTFRLFVYLLLYLQIGWLRAGRPLHAASSRIMVEPSGTLVIDSKLLCTERQNELTVQ